MTRTFISRGGAVASGQWSVRGIWGSGVGCRRKKQDSVVPAFVDAHPVAPNATRVGQPGRGTYGLFDAPPASQ